MKGGRGGWREIVPGVPGSASPGSATSMTVPAGPLSMACRAATVFSVPRNMERVYSVWETQVVPAEAARAKAPRTRARRLRSIVVVVVLGWMSGVCVV